MEALALPRLLASSAYLRRGLAIAAVPPIPRRRTPPRPTLSSSLQPPPRPSLSVSPSSHFSPTPSSSPFSPSDARLDEVPSLLSGELHPPRSGNGGGDAASKAAPAFTAVLLGWLGAEEKHMRRYADLYGARGMRTVRFAVRVGEVVGGFDLGRKVEGRIAALAEELVGWLDLEEEGGGERGLLFHTFSNTGWLVYGALLDNLRQRGDYMRKIKGCVVDSGGDPEINPQVWAAGFTAALLKKRSSMTQAGNADKLASTSGEQDVKMPVIEMMTLSVLEMFFAGLLKLPDVHRRLSRVLSILVNEQPLCPQLYLYSTADKVVPVHAVESFIRQQRQSGRRVEAYNFVSSPHVDHLRSFPYTYETEVDKFLVEWCVPAPSKWKWDK